MDKEQWIEIFTEINGRVPTEEEIQAGFQEGEITESEKIDNSFESTQYDSQTRRDEDLSQRVEDVQDKQEFSNDYTFCSSCGTKNSVNDERCTNCKKASKQTNDNVLYSTFKNNSLFRYLKHCFDTQRWGIIIYFAIVIFFESINSLGLGGLIFVLFTVFLLSNTGQSLICWIIGAKRIERSDYQEKVQQPVNEIIQKARQKGLNLPDNIEIRMIHNDVPAAYAIGMNKIIVTDSLLENPYFLEPKIMFELHRNYGDSRNSFWSGSSEAKEGAILFYGSIILIVALISFFLMFVKSVVKRDVYLSDQYMATIGCGEIHCYYIDNISEQDGSLAKGFCELGYPSKDKRISILQNNYNVRYTGV